MISYVVRPRVNPLSPTDPHKYYAAAKATGKSTIRSLAERISRESSLSIMDTKAVLEGFLQVIPSLLLEGKIVDLEDFGSFRITISSDGADTPEEFSGSLIKKANLLFRPGSFFKDRMKTAKFKLDGSGLVTS
ncbi:MAG: HU family DNA-binding protein [Bacteroidetes bacterium]|nr:HU family DNA-binding protein [Bacteroidota bacterium]